MKSDGWRAAGGAAWVLAACLAGCGDGGSVADEASDADVALPDDAADVPADDAADVPADDTVDVPADDAADAEAETPRLCPEPIAERCEPEAGDGRFFPYPPYELPVALRASEVGPGVRFLAQTQLGVLLAERLEVETRTLLVLVWDDSHSAAPDVRATLALPAGSGLRGVGAVWRWAEPGRSALPDLVLLACEDDRCRLYGADKDPAPAVLVDLPGGELPVSGVMNGLGWWPGGTAACAYGDGVHCFDGEDWTSPVPAGGACGPFRTMHTCGPRTIAVGDRGCRAISAEPDWLVAGGEPSAPDLFAAACDGDAFLLAGTGGIESERDRRTCPIADDAILFLDARQDWAESYVVGVTASGRIFLGRGSPGPETSYCYTGQTVERLVGAAAAYCGDAYNFNLLTEDALYGSFLCVII